MTDSIETERLVLFPYTKENLSLFNNDLPLFEETYGVEYRGEELDHLLTGFLKKLETEILQARKYYNGVVKTFNTKIETFPTSLIVGLFGGKFKKMAYLEVAEAERQNVKVQF